MDSFTDAGYDAQSQQITARTRNEMSANGPRAGSNFKTTRWSIVLAAQASSEDISRDALKTLCEQYWFPLYTFVRRRGYREHEAQDLTQDFFERFLLNGQFKQVDPERGRFRTFLLACMKHFLANEWDRTRAQRRGGDLVKLSLDFERAEGLYTELPSDYESADVAFDREWAQTMLATSLRELETEYAAAGKADLFHALKPVLLEGAAEGSYQDIGERLGLTEGTVKVAVHRLRKRYGALLRTQIEQTIENADLVDDELRYLLSIH